MTKKFKPPYVVETGFYVLFESLDTMSKLIYYKQSWTYGTKYCQPENILLSKFAGMKNLTFSE